MEQSELDEVDFQPRDYQIKLMEIAMRSNTIIYLPTGAGKTFIAVMVLRQLAAPLERPIHEGGKISIMLVNTVALVDQQSKYIRRFTHFQVGAYSGDMNVDLWNDATWQEEFNKHQVLVMTSQILVNLLGASRLDLSDVNLLIFDECHRGVNDHAMRQIMKSFGDLVEKQPRVIGLTATLLNKNCMPAQVMGEVRTLETTFHSKVATVDELKNVIGYSTNPTEIIRKFNSHTSTNMEYNAIKRLEDIISMLSKLQLNVKPIPIPKVNLRLLEADRGLKDLINLIKDTISDITMFGTFGGSLAVVAHMIQLERIRKHCQEAKLAAILEAVMCSFIFIKKLFHDEMKNYSEKEQIYKFSSHQVHTLLDILKEYHKTSKESLCGIIFVQRRFTAKVLYNVLLRLKTVDSGYQHLSPNFIVGYNSNPYNETRESLYNVKMNKKVLNQFRNNEINLLVASNVVEEGVDIPMCTLVVKFDKPVDYRAYIQSKGRARHKSSCYYIMINNSETEQFHNKYKIYQQVENMLNDYLVGQNERRYGPSRQQIQELYNEYELPPYYVDGPGSAQVNLVTAIPLLCRYCLTLPSDKYTVYAPNWFLEERNIDDTSTLYKVVIELPIISPILESIEGEYMKTKKQAKRAAALKACELLHKCGELDDKLLPKRHNVVDEDVSYFFKHSMEKQEKGVVNMKRRRVHAKQIPQMSKGCIEADNMVYLHIIELTPVFTPINESQRMMYELYSSPLCFGVLSSQPLPRLCMFSVYVSMGEIMVNLEVNKKTIAFTQEQILQLRTFHHLIFIDVLKVLKLFLIFDNDEDAEGLLVVPVLKNDVDYNIDFDVIINNKELVDQKTEPNDQEKLRMVVTEENYLGKIVTPWYRSDDKEYLVTSVCTDLSALSNFPSDDFDSYRSYFSDKYHTNVLNTLQPLLLVKGLSKKMNCLKPRHLGSKRNKEKSYDEMQEHLIPELCIKQNFPSDLWIQASLLPSILHRINTLLQAEELRRTIAAESGLGVVNLPEDEKWLPLTLDVHLLSNKEEEPSKTKSQKTTEDEPDNVVTLPKTAIQQVTQDFVSKKLESEFPWLEKDEPVDIERRLDVTLMDIQYYENFMSQEVSVSERIKKNDVINKKDYYPAITFDKEFIETGIHLLRRVKKNRGPELAEVFKTLATAKCNDIVNLERLETLGDSFLKLSMSLFITLRFPKYDEGKATALKSRLISNKNLYYIGVGKKLTGYLNLSDFAPTFEWKPPGFCVAKQVTSKINEKHLPSSSLFHFIFSREEQINGHITAETEQFIADYHEQSEEEKDESAYDSMLTFVDLRTVPDKSVADSVEALLGAYFQSCGFTGGLKLLEWLEIIPASEGIERLLQMQPANPILAKDVTNASINFHIPSWSKIEEALGYKFTNRAYLLQALTHSSYTPNRITNCYQTLEFLGDAILDFLITCHIFETCKNLNPGQLTDLRSALVNNITFAGFAVRCGFHKFLLFSNDKLLEYINNFVDFQESKNFAIDDEVLILLEQDDLYLSEHIDVPKVLGDVFEALAGAVFLDSKMSLETVWTVFYRIMWKEIELFRVNVPKNAIRLLYETTGAHPDFQNPVDIDTGGTMVALDFMLNGAKKRVYGFGENKNLAKKAAAKIAMRLLHN